MYVLMAQSPNLLILALFFRVDAGIPISFTSHLKNARVQERGKARLECEMSSKDVRVRWLKDGCDITASRRYVFTRQGKRAEVIIEDCQLADEGQYSVVCTQDNDAHEYVSSANLTVDGNRFYVFLQLAMEHKLTNHVFLLPFLCVYGLVRALCLSEEWHVRCPVSHRLPDGAVRRS